MKNKKKAKRKKKQREQLLNAITLIVTNPQFCPRADGKALRRFLKVVFE